MRYTVLGFNQSKAVESNLDLTDLMLLQYIMLANGNPSMKHIIKDEISYVWLAHSKIHEDLPILNIAEGTLRNKLSELKKDGWVISESVKEATGTKTYYSVTLKTISLTDTTDIVETDPRNSTVTCPRNSTVTCNNKLVNNKLNNTFTNVKVGTAKAIPRRTSLIKTSNTDTPNDTDIDTANITNVNTASIQDIQGNKGTLGNNGSRKKSRYEQCVDVIDEMIEPMYIELKERLKDYLSMRLAIKDKPMYVSGWKALIRKLQQLTDNIQEQIKIVEQSLENSWATFYPLKTRNYNSQKDVFAERGQVFARRAKKENITNVQF